MPFDRKPSLILMSDFLPVVLVLAAAAFVRQREPPPGPAGRISRISVNEDLVRTTADGVTVTGEISDADLDQVRATVSSLSKKPFFSATVTRNDGVQARTGVIRTDLEGGGNFFDLRLTRQEKWIVVGKGEWVSGYRNH